MNSSGSYVHGGVDAVASVCCWASIALGMAHGSCGHRTSLLQL